MASIWETTYLTALNRGATVEEAIAQADKAVAAHKERFHAGDVPPPSSGSGG